MRPESTKDTAAPLVPRPNCPYCRAPVVADDHKSACARCMAWHHQDCWQEFGRCASCRNDQSATPSSTATQTGRPPHMVPDHGAAIAARLPATLELEEGPGELILRSRCFSWHKVLTVLLPTLAIDALLVATKLSFGFEIIIASYAGLAVLVALALCVALANYKALGVLVNRREITVREQLLTVTTRPLPGLPLHVAAANLTQLHCRAGARRDDDLTYRLCAEQFEGGSLEIARGLDRGQARYLEQKLEASLGIADRPMYGEAFPG